jgi:hypothetical protein
MGVNMKTYFKKYSEKAWTGLIWLRIRTCKSLLWTWHKNVWFHKMPKFLDWLRN